MVVKLAVSGTGAGLPGRTRRFKDGKRCRLETAGSGSWPGKHRGRRRLQAVAGVVLVTAVATFTTVEGQSNLHLVASRQPTALIQAWAPFVSGGKQNTPRRSTSRSGGGGGRWPANESKSGGRRHEGHRRGPGHHTLRQQRRTPPTRPRAAGRDAPRRTTAPAATQPRHPSATTQPQTTAGAGRGRADDGAGANAATDAWAPNGHTVTTSAILRLVRGAAPAAAARWSTSSPRQRAWWY